VSTSSRVLTFVKAFHVECDKHLRGTKDRPLSERVKLARAAFPSWAKRNTYRRRLWNHYIKEMLGLKRLRDASPRKKAMAI